MVLLLTGKVANAPSKAPNVAEQNANFRKAKRGVEDIQGYSVREYIDSTGAKRVPDKITAFGVYLRETRGIEAFKREDLVRCFEDAAEPVPGKLSRDIKWTLKSGSIAPNGGQKNAYYVTNSGRLAVEACFSSDAVRRTKGMTSRTRRSGAKEADNTNAPESA